MNEVDVGGAARSHIEGRCDPGACFSCRVLSVGISGAALPTRSPEVVKREARVKQLHRDRDAFKSLRNEGMAPAKMHGAEDLARHAESKWEVETGHILPASIRDRALEAHDAIGKGEVPNL